MYIELFRTHEVKGSDGFKFQTIGKLTVYETKNKQTKLFECDTLERPWMDNKKNVSCVPPAPNENACYDWVKLDESPSFAYTHLWIKDVPNRTWIKVHVANSYDDLQGCIAVGEGFTYLEGDDVIDIINSRNTLKELMKILPKKGTINIISRVESHNRKPSIDVVSEIVPVEVPKVVEDAQAVGLFLDDYLS